MNKHTNYFVIPTAEPFFFPGGKTGCLLIHGFTGAPKEMRPLGERLSQAGFTVYGLRLPGHATKPEDMLRMRWQDWLASVEDGLSLLAPITEKTIVIGLSLGGMLALIAAGRYSLDGVVAIATLHHLPDDPRVPFIKPISLVKPFMAKGESVWFDKDAERLHVSYPDDPTRGYLEVKQILQIMRESLPQIKVPALLVYSKDDPTVLQSAGHMEAILSGLGTPEKQAFTVQNSGHVITEDLQRDVVADHIIEFIQQIVLK